MNEALHPLHALLCLTLGLAPGSACLAQAPARFDLLHIVVDGNSVLPAQAIEEAVYPFMGLDRGPADIEGAREALQKAYHDAGYETVLVEAPADGAPRDGELRLVATEGRIDRLRVSGTRYFSSKTLKAAVPALAAGEVPRMPAVQSELEAARAQSGDRRLTPILRAGRTPGTVEAELRVDDTLPLHGGVEINNRNSVNTSRTRVVGNLRYDNLWQRFHSASLQYQAAPEAQDVEVWAGTYVLPVTADWRLALYGIGIDSTSAINSAGALSVVGNGNIYGARAVRSLPTLADYSHSLTFGVDYKDFTQDIQLVGADDQSTPISYLPFMLRYEGVWRAADESSTRFAAEVDFALRGVGSRQREFSARRFAARSNFAYLVLELERTQQLPRDFALRGRFTGQVSESPLISNEQFSVGGLESVRGYHETEVLGDDGVFLSLELIGPRWAPVPKLGPLRIKSFIDWAHLSTKEALPETPEELEVVSVGMGFEWLFRRDLNALLDWGWPLMSAESIKAGDHRVHFKVAYDF